MKIKNVVVAGGGVLGSQIAFQAAYCGFDVTIWLRSEGSIGRTQPKLDSLKQTYIDTIEKMATPEGQTPNVWARGIADYEAFNKEACLEKAEKAYAGLKLELDMKKAVENADLVIESMAENAEEKIAFYKRLAPLLPEKTVIVTNSSTLLQVGPKSFYPCTLQTLSGKTIPPKSCLNPRRTSSTLTRLWTLPRISA